MTATTTIEVETSVVEAVAAATAARDAGIANAEAGDLTGWNKALIDQAIEAFAYTGRPFSANDLRQVLPDDLPGALMGARFLAASNADRIRFVGRTTSTKKNTHAKDVALWVGVIPS